MKLLLWALFKQPKRLKMYLNILRGTELSGRLERFDNMLAMFSQQELQYIQDQK